MTKDEIIARKKEIDKEITLLNTELNSIEANEVKEKYKDKYSCKYCKYSAIEDFSPDGWHNTCGIHNCTCCHNVCDEFAPDTEITTYIKQHNTLDYGEASAIETLVNNVTSDKLTDKEKENIKKILNILYEQ